MKITLLPGDGIGPEIMHAARRVINAAGVSIEWEVFEDPREIDAILASIKKNKLALKGPITTPVGKGYRSINVLLRKELDAFANVRPAKTLPGVPSRFKNVDLVVVRENLEDLYAGIEFEESKKDTAELARIIEKLSKHKIRRGSGISIKPISRVQSARITRFAFEYARQNNRKKVTVVHKANIMKHTDGLFLEEAEKVSKDYTDIEFESVIVDAMAMHLVIRPEEYDILLCPNLYGDIISDLAAGLTGGLGTAAGANIGENFALFEPVHGTAPDIAGQNKANPAAAIRAGVMLLRHAGEHSAAEKAEKALFAVLKKGVNVTMDIAGNNTAVTTDRMAEAIISAMKTI